MFFKFSRIWEFCRYVLVAVGVVVLLIVFNNIIRPFYMDAINKDIKMKIVATSERDIKALANNVRVVDICVNGRSIDLSKVKIKEESSWKYNSKDDFLYAYQLADSEIIDIELKNAHTVSVTLIQEVGSGVVEIILDGELVERINLYKDTSWDKLTYEYDLSCFVFPEGNRTFLFCLLIEVMLICVIVFRYSALDKYKTLIIQATQRIVLLWHLALCGMIGVLLVQYGGIEKAFAYVENQPQLFLKTVVLFFLSIQFLSLISGKISIAFGVITSIGIGLVVANNIKILNRGMPLLPWDFVMAKEAFSVVENYEINLNGLEVAIMALVVITIIFVFIIADRNSKISKAKLLLSVPCLICLSIFVNWGFIKSDVESKNSNFRVYQVGNYYQDRGFFPAFFEYCVYLNPSDKPENYSKAVMERIGKEIVGQRAENSVKEEKPTIIAIMSESFWDVERLDTVSFDEEILPNYNKLKNEAIHGELFTHVLNGGTVTTEFEFLTGFSGEFFPQDYMVYGNFLDQGFSSVVGDLKDQGYSTLAMHPYIETNYNRENAYKKFGFDNCLFIDDFKQYEEKRKYVSDQSLTERIIKEYEKNDVDGQPQFIFAVTMQNHGGYWEETIDVNNQISYKTDVYGDVAQKCMEDYFAGLHASDQALEYLIDYYRNVDEEVIIVFFGDHMSDAGPKDDRMLSKTSWTKDELVYDYEIHRVPFLVWSNFETINIDWGIMGVNDLLPSVFDHYGIETNLFWKYLHNANQEYVAADSKLVVYRDGTYKKLEDMSEEQKALYDEHRLLQYDYIWGERYVSYLWENSVPK